MWGLSQGLGRSGRSMNQGQSEIHDPGREGEAGEGGGSALQPQEGKASAARAVPASLHRSIGRACPGTVQHQVLLKGDGISS